VGEVVGAIVASVTLLGQIVGFVEPQGLSDSSLKKRLLCEVDRQNAMPVCSFFCRFASFPKYSVNQGGHSVALTSTVH